MTDSHSPVFDPDTLIKTAQQRCELTEFDEFPLMEPLTAICHALNEEADLTEQGVQVWQERLINVLTTRLRAQWWWTEYPEILDEHVESPLVILGLTRSGTTLLQRLISADPRFYSAAWWENRFPVPAEDDVEGSNRRAQAVAEIDALLAASPELASIHPFNALEADEDILLLDQTLLSTTSESMAPMPGYREWLKGQDKGPAYRYLKRMLQFLQWQKRQRGEIAQRWLLKTPMHLAHIPEILEVFPDAEFVQTHRDPVTTIASYSSMIYNQWLASTKTPDKAAAGHLALNQIGDYLDACLAFREQHPEQAFVDVDFKKTMKAPLDVVADIYQAIDFPMTDEASASVAAWMAANPRDNRPPHRYDLAGYGLSESQVAERFAAYRKRFILD